MEYSRNGLVWYGGEDKSDRDYCGNDCYWRVEKDVLTISGNGKLEWVYKDGEEWKAPNENRGMCYSEVIIDDEITAISRAAFREQPVKKVRMPSCVTTIERETFHGCVLLSEITIPDNVKEIGVAAFAKCKSLKIIAIPKSVERIQMLAFCGCNSLECLITAGGIKEMHHTAFLDCTQLGKVAFLDGTIQILPNAFEAFDALTSVSIPEGVTEIGRLAFSNCKSLESIVIPDSVMEIGDRAFASCLSLSKIVLSKNLMAIEEATFFACKSLQNVVIPPKVTEIGSWVFSLCSSLTCVSIPDSVTKIAPWAFHESLGLEKVIFNGTKEQWVRIVIGEGNKPLFNAVIEFTGSTMDNVMEYNRNGIVWYGGETRNDADYCGKGCYWRIQDDTLIISGNGNFDWSYQGERYLKMPPGQSRGLHYNRIVIEAGMKSISSSTFQGYSIKSIELPNSLINIGMYAFSCCSSLESVTVSDNGTESESEYNECDPLTDDFGIGEHAFDNCVSLVDIVIPDGVIEIGKWAFSGCSSLKNVTIPDSVTKIEEWAFQECTALEKVLFKGTKEKWEQILIEEGNELLCNAAIEFVGVF